MATPEGRTQNQTQKPRASMTPEAIDPVCGMKLEHADPVLSIARDGEKHYFCSKLCMDTFRRDPEQYS